MREALRERVSNFTAPDLCTLDAVEQGQVVCNGNGVENLATVDDNASGEAHSKQRQYCSALDAQRGHAERFEHDCRGFFAIGLGVQGDVGEDNRVPLRGDLEFRGKHVLPKPFEIIPVGNEAVLDRVN